jgi:prophage regulatory protein
MTKRHLRRPQVEATTGLSRSSIYDMMKKGEFPRPIRIGKRAVAWSESAIADWLATRPTSHGADK